MNVPAPTPNPSSFRSAGALAIIASFVIVVAGMKAASMIVVPFLLAVFIAVIVTPLFIGLLKFMRAPFALGVIVLLLLGASTVLFVILSNSLVSFNEKMPEYQRKLTDQREFVIGWLKDRGVDFNIDLERRDPPPEDEDADPEDQPAVVPDEPAEEPSAPDEDADGETEVAYDENGEAIEPPTYYSESTGPMDPSEVRSAEDVVRGALDPSIALRYLGTVTAAIMTLLSQGFLILIVVIFILFEAMVLPGKVRALPGMNDELWQRLQEIVDNIRRYMLLKTLVSMVTGMLVATMLTILGIPFALLLGLLAFMLNFVPNVGSIIAAIPAVLLALVEGSVGMAVGIGIGYMAINIGIGNGIEPRIMGRGMGLSPLIILLSLIFWGWVLGPMGMLLSVPLTMTAKIVLDADPNTKWLALLMSGSAARRAAEAQATAPLPGQAVPKT